MNSTLLKEKNNWLKKIKRTASSPLPIKLNRKGKYLQDAACCFLPKKCTFLKEKEGNYSCIIYKLRLPVCRKYPRTLEEQICFPCGYYFGN